MFKKILSGSIIFSFFLTSLSCPLPQAYADTVLDLPQPGTMINVTPAYVPVIVKGLHVHPENPVLFDFIVDTGNSGIKVGDPQLKIESEKLIKYFLASLTIPEDDLWVNLSPYEKNRIIPEQLGKTVMGRDMLAEDYILKQLTASLIYPEKNLGKEFWNRIYAKAQQVYGTSSIPVNTFNKVWIVADKADVYVHDNTAFVVGAHLKVMLEEDYLSLEKHNGIMGNPASNNTHSIASQIVREIVLPELEKEVNSGKNFANLRQIFQSMILATWYKKDLKEALLNQVYSNKAQVNGVDVQDKTIKDKIYQQYLRAYKTGVFNYIKEDIRPDGQAIPRKYFSGGLRIRTARVFREVPAFVGSARGVGNLVVIQERQVGVPSAASSNAMVTVEQAATKNPQAIKDLFEIAQGNQYGLAGSADADFKHLLSDEKQELFTISHNLTFPKKKIMRTKVLLAFWAAAYAYDYLGKEKLEAFLNIAQNYFKDGNQARMQRLLEGLNFPAPAYVSGLSDVLTGVKALSDNADELLIARQDEQIERISNDAEWEVSAAASSFSLRAKFATLLSRAKLSPWVMKGDDSLFERFIQDRVLLSATAPHMNFANNLSAIDLTVLKYSFYHNKKAGLLLPNAETALRSFLSKLQTRTVAIHSLTSGGLISEEAAKVMLDEVQSLYEFLSTQTRINRERDNVNLTVKAEFTHVQPVEVLEDYKVNRYPTIARPADALPGSPIFQVTAQTNHGVEVIGQLTFTGDMEVVDQIVAQLNDLRRNGDLMSEIRRDTSPQNVFAIIRREAIKFAANSQNKLSIVDYYNDAFAAASGEQRAHNGLLRGIPGIAFIIGTGINGAVVDAQGNHVTLDGILTELGHNIVWRAGLGRWVFTGPETRGNKPELAEGDYTIEQAFSGPNIARRFTGSMRIEDIVRYLGPLLENSGFSNGQELSEAINQQGALTEQQDERRQAASKIVLTAITEGVRQNDPKIIQFVETIGQGLGQALAAFMQGYLNDSWAEHFILVSGVSENFARVEGKEGDEDVFVHSIHEGFKSSLKAIGGLDEGRIDLVAKGIERSKIGWERETMAAAITPEDLEAKHLDAGEGYLSYAVSVGGTKIGVSALTEEGDDVSGSHLDVKWAEKGSSHPNDIVPLIVNMIFESALQNKLDISKIIKVGVAFPAPVNKEKGVVGDPFGPPNLHPEFANFNLAGAIQEAWAKKLLEVAENNKAMMVEAKAKAGQSRQAPFEFDYQDRNLKAVGRFNLTDYKAPSVSILPKVVRRIGRLIIRRNTRVGQSETFVRGGIDLNARNMQMGINGDRLDVSFDPALIEQFRQGDFSGVRPEILNITPIADMISWIGTGEPVHLN